MSGVVDDTCLPCLKSTPGNYLGTQREYYDTQVADEDIGHIHWSGLE